MFESLETRTMMSASLSNGVLTITETNGADTVVVGKNPQGKFFVTENGIPSLFLWNAVNKVVVNLLAGADNFSAQPAVNKPLEVHGGDVIKGLGGDDWLDGGVGGVAVYSQNTGNDRLEGGDGNDVLHASDYGNCSLYGGAGNDWIHGWGGNDYIDGGDGDDVCYGGMGNDVMYGGAGSDYLYGEDGNDVINGDNGVGLFHNILQFPNTKFKALQPILINPIIGVSGATPTALATTPLVGPVMKPASLIGIITKLPPIDILPIFNFVF